MTTFEPLTGSFQRVLPRDLFNEAKLLKCIGRLSLLALDWSLPIRVEMLDENDRQFDVQQDMENGELFADNVRVTLLDATLPLVTPYNHKGNWPLLLIDSSDERIEVFTDSGALTGEFLAYIGERTDHPAGKSTPTN